MENKILEPTKNESRNIKFMILLGIFSILYFLLYFFQPEHTGDPLLFTLLTIAILYSVLKKLYMWYNYSNITIPVKPEILPDFKVDILTTYFPGEPYQMTITTLEAINKITYPHTTYLCDEGNDPFLKKFCKENGIIHVTRDNRINAKAGNINNALEKHATGDICVILDPDHIPEPHFLDSILPYFENPEIGFVQIVQSYYNIKETLVARGAAEQTFQFYGPMMMTLNAYGAVNAIGANCVFRRTALDSIGGHAPGLCEDMHTAMLLYAEGWKAVYVPEVLAKGLAPSNLTNFFKQQLKWSRGTFDLLVNVYPKIFHKLTGRQKIHFGILPLHYLGGVISFINFLIPVLALIFSTTPWKGNFIDFALVILPVLFSSLLIRTYIQKWVIEKKERGFHLVGGLLHINTWWIYMLGLIYTIRGKDVPYLPTPKEDEWNTNLKIIIPNAVVAIISILAIVYGLYQDLSPFTLLMAGFAFFNACIMFFGIYMTFRVTNRNNILKSGLKRKTVVSLYNIKLRAYRIANGIFNFIRRVAAPLLLLLLITAMNLKQKNDLSRWENIESSYFEKINNQYLGIFHPVEENGISDLEEINLVENIRDINFDIISFYLAWNEESLKNFPHKLVQSIYEKNSIPMITWEPWASGLPVLDPLNQLNKEQKVFKYITEGYYDEYIKEFAGILKSYDKPVFLRFAHEFDNPQYPWSSTGGNTPQEFIAAWKHVVKLFKEENAYKVVYVWNPWKSRDMTRYYPGDEYVDWIGITALNYGPLAGEKTYYPFKEIYEPFHKKFSSFSKKPVMLAEFGSVKLGNRQTEWIKEAVELINSDYKEISAIVVFNSAVDKNIPNNDWFDNKYIDWTINSFALMNEIMPGMDVRTNLHLMQKDVIYKTNPVTRYDIRGVRYNKPKDWKNNYYAITRDVLIKDFTLMEKSGINTIYIQGGSIYDYNLFTYSRKYNLNVIYQFQIDPLLDFIHSEEELLEMEKNILDKVEELKNNNNVIGYSIPFGLGQYYAKPLLFYQQQAYLSWLNSLIPKIKDIDPNKSIILDMKSETAEEMIYEVKKVNQYLDIDSYGLVLEDTTNLRLAISKLKKENISFFVSSLNPEDFTKNLASSDIDIVLQNWQDERYSNSINFNGLINFNGDKKIVLNKIENFWGSKNELQEINNGKLEILKPAVPLIPGESYSYQAQLYDDGWVKESKKYADYNYDWYLIKNDLYNNPLAAKKVGKGREAEIKIPEDYKNYKLMLIAKNQKNGYTISSIQELHTRYY